MSFLAHNTTFENTVKSALTGAYPSVAIQYENVALQQPDGTWVSLALIDGPGRQVELGARTTFRHVGVAQIDVLVPQLSGTVAARTIAEFLGNAFRTQTVYGVDGCRIIYRAPEFTARGAHNGFYCIMVRIPYWRDEPRS